MTTARAVPAWTFWSSTSSHPLARLSPAGHRASSSRACWVCASGREHGAYCERWGFIVLLTAARAGLSTRRCRYFSGVGRLPLKSQIRALESWEKTPGGACCDPDKTHAAKGKKPGFRSLRRDQILAQYPCVVRHRQARR